MARRLFFLLLAFSTLSRADFIPVKVTEAPSFITQDQSSFTISFSACDGTEIPIGVGDYVRIAYNGRIRHYESRYYSVTNIQWSDEEKTKALSIEITVTKSTGHLVHQSKRLAEAEVNNKKYILEVVPTELSTKLKKAQKVVFFAAGEASNRAYGVMQHKGDLQTYCLIHTVREGKQVLHSRYFENLGSFYKYYETGKGASRLTARLDDVPDYISRVVSEYGIDALYVISGTDRTPEKESQFETDIASRLTELDVPTANIVTSSW